MKSTTLSTISFLFLSLGFAFASPIVPDSQIKRSVDIEVQLEAPVILPNGRIAYPYKYNITGPAAFPRPPVKGTPSSVEPEPVPELDPTAPTMNATLPIIPDIPAENSTVV